MNDRQKRAIIISNKHTRGIPDREVGKRVVVEKKDGTNNDILFGEYYKVIRGAGCRWNISSRDIRFTGNILNE